MIEKVAEAIKAAMSEHVLSDELGLDYVLIDGRVDLLAAARAAIEVISKEKREDSGDEQHKKQQRKFSPAPR